MEGRGDDSAVGLMELAPRPRLTGARLECPRALDSPDALKDMSAMSSQHDHDVSRVLQCVYDSTNPQRMVSDQDWVEVHFDYISRLSVSYGAKGPV